MLTRKNTSFIFLALLVALGVAQADTSTEAFEIRTWGTMREVLREGKSEERVNLAGLLTEHTIAIGALAGLAGEITVLDGEIHEARFDDGELSSVVNQGDSRATLLVMAEVKTWDVQALPALADFEAMERAVRAAAVEAGLDVTQPFPFVVEGLAADLKLHVIAGACPIATPDGPPPGRFSAEESTVTLVGFYAENQAGRLTHHNRESHVHVVGSAVSGHLDEVSFVAGAELRLPR